ncbi:hypothetical protein O181_065225 [Austropuccinia psidii MF-1]|uniref:Uncharacterized protein n=1 Tax=Austropuccinia psidii MF-1 TaxID=1389203 RepID=A0A9Q3ELW0_9BASI|nr:hypothetical protein [Austropuccinia psidii MF-1]
MSPVHLRDLGFQRNEPDNKEGWSTRRPGRGHLGRSSHCKTLSSSAAETPQRLVSMENGQEEVQAGIPLGRTWRKFPEDLSQRNRLQRPYSNHQRLESHQALQTPGGEGKQDKGESSHYPSYRRQLTQTGNTQIPSVSQGAGQISSPVAHTTQNPTDQWPRVTILHNPRKPNDPAAVGFGERSAQEPEVVVHNSRISSPINRNITPTQIEHNVVAPESNLNSDALCLKMSQYAESTQKEFAELEASHERMKILTASMDKIVKTRQEGHDQLAKPLKKPTED